MCIRMMAVAFVSSAIIDGRCYGFVIWKNPADGVAYGIFYFLAAYVVVLIIFIFCYGKILLAIRRQASVMAGHNTAASPTNTQTQQSNQIQANVITTMISVCVFYAVAWLPENVYFFLMNLRLNLTFLDSGYYAVLFIAFIYICVNLTVSQPICNGFNSLLSVDVATISLYLCQPVHLCHQI